MTGMASRKMTKAASDPKTIITIATPPSTKVVIHSSPVSTPRPLVCRIGAAPRQINSIPESAAHYVSA